MSTAADALHEEIRALERRKSDLAAQIAALRADNDRRREQLALLEQGHPARRRTRRWVTFWALTLVALITVTIYAAADVRTRRAVERPLAFASAAQPHVMISSKPTGASVSFGGGALPKLAADQRAVTPLAFDAQVGARYEVTVAAAGHAPRTRTLRITAEGGVHWHAELLQRGGPAFRPGRTDGTVTPPRSGRIGDAHDHRSHAGGSR